LAEWPRVGFLVDGFLLGWELHGCWWFNCGCVLDSCLVEGCLGVSTSRGCSLLFSNWCPK